MRFRKLRKKVSFASIEKKNRQNAHCFQNKIVKIISKVLLIALLSVCTKLFMIISLAANSKMSYIVLFRSAFSKSNSFLHKPKFFGQNLMISNFREGNRMANKILVNHSFCSFNQNIWMNLNYTYYLIQTTFIFYY